MREHFAAFLGLHSLAFSGLCCTLIHILTYIQGHGTDLFFLRVIFPNISVMKRRTCFLSQEPTAFHSFLSYTIVDCQRCLLEETLYILRQGPLPCVLGQRVARPGLNDGVKLWISFKLFSKQISPYLVSLRIICKKQKFTQIEPVY